MPSKYSKQQKIDAFWIRVDKKGRRPETLTTKKKWKRTLALHPEIEGTRCWEWLGCLTPRGCGSTGGPSSPYGEQLAHRASWVLNCGDIPPETPCVLHKCDNPRCVRPLHLFLGTHQENMIDMTKKCRRSVGKSHSASVKGKLPFRGGEDNPMARLTHKQARKIVRLYESGNYTQRQLGRKFKVHSETAGRIIRTRKYGKAELFA